MFEAIGVYAQSSQGQNAFAFYTLGFIPHVLQNIFFILFLLGLLIVLSNLVLGYDRIRVSRSLQGDFLMIILMVLNLIFLIFYIKYAEDRYLFECMISFIFISAIAINWVFSFVRKYNRTFAIIAVVLLLILGAYSNYQFGDNMIKTKATSYAEMKEAFTWLKANSPENSTFLGSGTSVYAYYADRTPLLEPDNEIGLPGVFENADYLILHAFTQQPKYFTDYLESKNLTIVNAFFFDAAKTQPAVIIYKK